MGLPALPARRAQPAHGPAREGGAGLSPAVRPLPAAALPEAVELLARSFRDHPLNRAAIRGDGARRLRCNRLGMRLYLPGARRAGWSTGAFEAGRLVGVLVAAPPGAWPFPPPPVAARLATALRQGLRVARRWALVSEALETHHPLGPHWYLAVLGVDAARRGCGIGTALARDWLAQVDAEGGRAYLETDVQQNLRFYARLGFEPVGRSDVLGVPVWRLERPARGGA